jgi:hypothetical protein
MVTAATGRARLGCLVALLLVTAAVYFGINVGEVYWKFYRYQDAMAQEAHFAQMRTDQAIERRLKSRADSLGLPEAAGNVQIRRDDARRRISIEAAYSERVELPGFVRTFDLRPRAEGTY